MKQVSVEELWTYPIKSCSGVQLTEAEVTATGFAYDRNFMLVHAEDDSFITQRAPGMEKLAAVRIALGTDHLAVTADDFGTEEIPLSPAAEAAPISTAVHGKPCVGAEVPNGSAYFSRFLGTGARLLQIIEAEPRYVSEPYRQPDATNRVAFEDGFPFLLTSRASLHALHRQSGLPYNTVPMDRFRPSIVVDGMDLAPFEEDGWRQIRIGHVGAYVVRACDRCQIPSIIQRGEHAGQEGELKVKARFLKNRSGTDLAAPAQPKGRFFGQNLNHFADSVGKKLKVGQEVVVLERGEPNILLRAA